MRVLRVEEIRVETGGRTLIQFHGDPGGLFLLLRGSTVTQIAQPVATNSTTAEGRGSFEIADSNGMSFYRIQELPAIPPPTIIAETSPAHGELGVSVTRETIIHFSAPLAADTIIGTDRLYAVLGGRRFLSRVELSGDRRRATLFYLEPLPGSSRITVFLDSAGLKDYLGSPVDPSGNGRPGSVHAIEFDTLSTSPLPDTAVIGRVFASELVPGPDTGTNAVNKPLAGVTITVDGMEETLRTVTDAGGNFTLSPVPAGRFFVHIDGRTAVDEAAGIRYPDRAYYPSVGKAWEAVAGQTTNLAGGTGTIFLPLITPGTLQPVSATIDTSISFPPNVVAANPALAGVSITVPANALFGDNGVRGGKVGIAPVPPDRLPGPLPPGLELPLVITVQTDGPLNFDRPAPICFPNSRGLKPGEKTTLVSFNHDKGIWEPVGSMTASEDGRLVCTDPGVGIVQPGWHGDCDCDVVVPPNYEVAVKVCDPEKENLVDCQLNCGEVQRNCVEYATKEALRREQICVPKSGTKEYSKCAREMFLTSVHHRNSCFKDHSTCVEGCEGCYGDSPLPETGSPPGGNGSASGTLRAAAVDGSDEIIAAQLTRLVDQMLELIRPFAEADLLIPDDIVNRIAALREEATAVAGGDPVRFLNERIAAAEDRIAASARRIGREPADLQPGNAPPYPVLYEATILSPTRTLVLRGETGPLGQYSLMVRRGGTLLDVKFYDPKTKGFALITPNLSQNARFRLPRFTLAPLPSDAVDSDHDGLPDLVEDVYGTDPARADSDGDGIPDDAEASQGTNPLDGLVVQTGVIASTKTPGAAVDVWAGNNFIVTAEGASGVSVFNAYQGQNPTLVAHTAIKGIAQRVAGSGNFIAVAAGQAGLAILDLSTPAEARIRHQVLLPGAQAVAADASMAYVGTDAGLVSAVDLVTGVVRSQTLVTNKVWDLALAGDYVYAVTDNRLLVISMAEGQFELAGSADAPVGAVQYRRLFVGGGVAYATHRSGYHTFDLSDPARPILLAFRNTAQFGWQQIVANGSGLGVAAVGPNSTDEGPHDVSLYDVRDPRTNDVFLTTFVTPGLARAVTIFNGLAYVADDTSGLSVVNYQPYDARGVPPAIALDTSFRTNAAVEMSPVRVTANTSDDVQVRLVEFYLDGVNVFTDGNFPFEYRFTMPGRGATRTHLVLRARAFDTGGNATWSDEIRVELLPDTTPPRVAKSEPTVGAKRVSTLFVYFTELIDPATLNPASFRVFSAGADGQLGTADDSLMRGGTVSYRAESMAASLSFASPLPNGTYRAVVMSGVSDLAGNRLAADFSWQFRVADAVFWITEGDGRWGEPVNWSVGRAPGPDDDVVIDLVSRDWTITHETGADVVKSLTVGERLELTGGSLQVLRAAELHRNVTLRGGTLKGGTVEQTDTGRLIVTGHPGNTLESATVRGDLHLPPSAWLRIRGGLSVDGRIMVDAGAVLECIGHQTFDAGSVLFPDARTPGFLDVGVNTTLTLGPRMVVSGKTANFRLMSATSRLINQGLISAEAGGLGIFISAGGGRFENAGIMESRNGATLNINVPFWDTAGRIDASTGGTLTLSGSWNNSGTINATDAIVNLGGTFALPSLGTFQRKGGTVNLTGVMDLQGGTLALDAATGPWTLFDGTIKNGTVAENGAELSFTGHPGNTLDGVTVQGDVHLHSGGRVRIQRGLTLTGIVLVDSGAVIEFTGDQTFNTSSIVFRGNSGFLDIGPNTTLTLGPVAVVRGQSGSFRGSAGGRLINQGLISADTPGSAHFIAGGQFENVGALEAKNGGSLSIMHPTVWNNSGRIEASGGGTLTLEGAWRNTGTIDVNQVTVSLGGTFKLADLAAFRRVGGTVTLAGALDLQGGILALNAATGSWGFRGGTIKDGTITESEGAWLLPAVSTGTPGTFDHVSMQGDLDLSQGGQVLVRNGLTLAGAIVIDQGGSITFASSQSLESGRIVFAGNSGFLGIASGATLTLGPSVTLRGKSGLIGRAVSGPEPSKLLNRGLISVDVPGGALSVQPGEFENAGTIAATAAGSTLSVIASPFVNTGVIQESNGGAVRINP